MIRNEKESILEIFYFDAGGGHRAASKAITESIAAEYPDWKVRQTNLQSLLISTDPIYQVTGVRAERVYNAALKRGWTKGSKQFLRTLQTGIQLNAPFMKKVLQMHWQKHRPDLVVSVIPNFNRVMFEVLKVVHPDVPFITIMTDMADSPPHFWMEDQDQYIICGSHKAMVQAHMTGFYRPERVLEMSGMILRPSFYGSALDPEITHDKLGLDPGKPIAMIMFGGNGSKVSAAIARDLRVMDVQCIVMCGTNTVLLQSLQGLEGCCAIGFTDKVPAYMRLAHFFVGKPGPASVTEALHMGLPVIVENNAKTMIQERYNVIWLEEQKLGISVPDFSKIDLAVRFLLTDDRMHAYRQNALKLKNRAVFEVPTMLDKIMLANPASNWTKEVASKTASNKA